MEIQQTAITAEVLARIIPEFVPEAVRKDHAKGVASPARMSLDTFKDLHALTKEGGSMAKLLSKLSKPITSEQLVEIKRLLKYAPYEYDADHGYRVKPAKPEFKKPPFQQRRVHTDADRPRLEKARQDKHKPEAKPVPHAATNGLRPIKSPLHAVIALLSDRLHHKLAQAITNDCHTPEFMSKNTYSALRQLGKFKLNETVYNEANGQPVTLQVEVDRLMAASPWTVHPKRGVVEKSEMPVEASTEATADNSNTPVETAVADEALTAA